MDSQPKVLDIAVEEKEAVEVAQATGDDVTNEDATHGAGSETLSSDDVQLGESAPEGKNAALLREIYDLLGGAASLAEIEASMKTHDGDMAATVNALLDDGGDGSGRCGNGPARATTSAANKEAQVVTGADCKQDPSPQNGVERDEWVDITNNRKKQHKKSGLKEDSVVAMLESLTTECGPLDHVARQRLLEQEDAVAVAVLEDLKFQMVRKKFKPRNVSAVVMKLVEKTRIEWQQRRRSSSRNGTTAPPAAVSVAGTEGEEGDPPITPESSSTVEPAVIGAATQRSAAERAGMGLKNEVGERNCFINVVIQSMWHLRAFRDGFLALQSENDQQGGEVPTAETDMGNQKAVAAEKVLAALRGVFAEYQRAEAEPVPDGGEAGLVEPASLREAMSMKGAALNDKEFQVGDFADAAEAHMTLLELLGDTAAGPLVEKVFGMALEEKNLGPANEEEPPLAYTANVHYVSARGICEASKGLGGDVPPDFDQVLRSLLHEVHEGSDAKVVKLTNKPLVFTLGLVWTSPNEPAEYIKAVVNTVSDSLLLNSIFDGANEYSPLKAQIRGMFCYYGKHFCAVFKSEERGCWLVFDDSMVNEVGTWADVQDKCYRGALQPCLLFYETSDDL